MSKPSLSDPRSIRDRQDDWNEHFDRTRRREIIELITDEVIAEHAENPTGYRNFHSPELQRVLNYMRVQPVLGKYFIYAAVPWSDYRIATIHERGEAPVLLNGHHYKSEKEAMHGVFLLRIEDIKSSSEGDIQ